MYLNILFENHRPNHKYPSLREDYYAVDGGTPRDLPPLYPPTAAKYQTPPARPGLVEAGDTPGPLGTTQSSRTR